MAAENPQITASIVEASEYPDLVTQYNVSGVPQTVVNDRNTILGAMPEASFVAQALEGFID